MKKLENNFQSETTTVWSFPERGNWATHNPKYRGNWAPQIPRNLMLKYTNESDLILDPMMGAGTTIIEARLLNRNAIGLDINPEAVKLTQENIKYDFYLIMHEHLFVFRKPGEEEDISIYRESKLAS